VARHGAAAAEQAAILDVETKKITGAEGLKSLGWRGNEAKKAAEKVCSLPTPRAFTLFLKKYFRPVSFITQSSLSARPRL